MIETPASEAACTAAGNSKYWYCSVYQKYFADADGTIQIEEDSWIIPAKGHTVVTDAAVAATCTTEGKTEGSHCSVCGEVLSAQTVVPALGHVFEEDAYISNGDATCQSDGTETAKCSRCEVTSTRTETGSKSAHNYVVNSVVNSTFTKKGYTVYKCSECGDTYIDNYTDYLTGWSYENGGWKYYANGQFKTGWLYVKGNWYYMDSDGTMHIGWKYINGKWYYLNSSGIMAID